MSGERLVGVLLIAAVLLWAVVTVAWLFWAERREERRAELDDVLDDVDAWLASPSERPR